MNDKKICKVAICDNVAMCKELCGGHYYRLARTGDLQEDVPLRKIQRKRFTKVDRESWSEGFKGCVTCKAVLPLEAFGSQPSGYLGVDQSCRECRKVKAKADYAKRDYRQVILDRSRSRAKKKGVPFDLTLEDIAIPTHCPALGIELNRASEKMTDASPSIDRIIPEFGYVPGNIMIISNRANRIKADATAAELRAIAKYIDGGI